MALAALEAWRIGGPWRAVSGSLFCPFFSVFSGGSVVVVRLASAEGAWSCVQRISKDPVSFRIRWCGFMSDSADL